MSLLQYLPAKELENEDAESFEKVLAPYHPVYCVLSSMVRQHSVSNFIMDIANIVCQYHGWESPWSSVFKGNHIRFKQIESTNDDSNNENDENDSKSTASAARMITDPLTIIGYDHVGPKGSAWQGNVIRTKYALPIFGIVQFTIMFDNTSYEVKKGDNMKMDYFVGIMSGKESKNIENINIYNSGIIKNGMFNVYGIDNNSNSIKEGIIIDGSAKKRSDFRQKWENGCGFGYKEYITMIINMDQHTLTFLKNGQRMDKSETPNEYDIKFMNKLYDGNENDEIRRRQEKWYPIVSIYHANVSCTIVKDYHAPN